jgi:hypothetical protein
MASLGNYARKKHQRDGYDRYYKVRTGFWG